MHELARTVAEVAKSIGDTWSFGMVVVYGARRSFSQKAPGLSNLELVSSVSIGEIVGN